MYKYSQIKKFEKEVVEIKCPCCNKKDTSVYADTGNICVAQTDERTCSKCGDTYTIKYIPDIIVDVQK